MSTSLGAINLNINQMRDQIIAPYNSTRWHQKVSTMSDEQVIAIYFRFLNAGKFDKMLKRTKRLSEPASYIYNCEQCGASYYRDNQIGRASCRERV